MRKVCIFRHFENLCVARCRHDYGLRTLLAKEVEGQMSIVTQLPDVSAQSGAFISGRSKVGLLKFLHLQDHYFQVCN